jgi:hypothetical protein
MYTSDVAAHICTHLMPMHTFIHAILNRERVRVTHRERVRVTHATLNPNSRPPTHRQHACAPPSRAASPRRAPATSAATATCDEARVGPGRASAAEARVGRRQDAVAATRQPAWTRAGGAWWVTGARWRSPSGRGVVWWVTGGQARRPRVWPTLTRTSVDLADCCSRSASNSIEPCRTTSDAGS